MATGLLTNGHGRHAPAHTVEPEKPPDLLEQVIQATQAAPRYSIEDMERMAKKTAASRLFKMDENQTFVLMMIAEAKGLHPIEAVQRYDVIDGRPSMKAEAMLADFQRIGGRVDWLVSTDTKCVAVFWHPKHAPKGVQVQFTMADAKQAGLSHKRNWITYPSNMLRWRVVSNGIRMVAPGVVAGIYTPDELGDIEMADMGIAAPVTIERQPPQAGDDELLKAQLAAAADDGRISEPTSDIRTFIEEQVSLANDQWRNILGIEGKMDLYMMVANTLQVANHLVKTWIASGALDEGEIKTDGKRDKFLVALALKKAWNQDCAEVKTEVLAYLGKKLGEAARSAGIELSDDIHGDEPGDAAEPEGEFP